MNVILDTTNLNQLPLPRAQDAAHIRVQRFATLIRDLRLAVLGGEHDMIGQTSETTHFVAPCCRRFAAEV